MPGKEKVVVAKRGCTCCGTGCTLIGAVVPFATFAAFETLGVVAALALWPTLLLGVHGARRALRR